MTQPPAPCTAPEASQLDFWLGLWDLSWPAEQTGGEQGEVSRGTNRIERLFAPCAIEETFSTDDGKFQGRSLSVFDSQAGKWRQTWVDNQGTYLLVSGGLSGENFELQTDPYDRDGQKVINRMVFRDIHKDSLQWIWQGSRDGGETWNDLWIISYRRGG